VASLSFHGRSRRLRVKLNRVPAELCERCRFVGLSPEMRRHLSALGLNAAEGWNMALKPEVISFVRHRREAAS
jgi:hypothetical protein